MKILIAILLVSLGLNRSMAQGTTLVIDTTMFTADQQIYLASSQGWVYHAGHNPAWASPDLKTNGWLTRKLSDLSVKDADKSGRVEGWFRLRLQLDSTFRGMPVWFRKSGWAAADLYVDGQLLASYGSTGTAGKSYQEYFFLTQLATPVKLIPGKTHLIALHLVDYKSPFTPGKLKSQIGVTSNAWLRLIGSHAYQLTVDLLPHLYLSNGFMLAVSLMVTLLLWLLGRQKLDDKEKTVVQLLAAQSSLTTLLNAYNLIKLPGLFGGVFSSESLSILVALLSVFLLLALLLRMVDHRWFHRATLPILLVPIITFSIDTVSSGINYLLSSIVFSLLVLVILYILIAFRKRLQGPQWAIVTGLFFALTFALVVVVVSNIWPTITGKFSLVNLLINALPGFAYYLAIPLSFLIYVALRFKEILTEVQQKASAIVQITEEKRELLATQNQLLEQQVEVRTAELKASQTQLIQKEKLASLGELTAGIAHEIQNPLNFVNNFAEVSTELIDELKEGPFQKLPDSEKEYADEILGDLTSNLQKIHHHGGRASSIVKGMLEHSRTESGEKRPTDLNALADEYLKIAYHGLRAKDKSRDGGPFNCELVTDFDSTLKPVNVAPQEIGRVLLNLYNNAFYAVHQRQIVATRHALSLPETYQPTITVATKKMDDQPGRQVVVISVKDNGSGIPESVKAKIFQPFFTTKPTGEGTGLGLSLSYDIITKGHGGTLTVTSTPGEGTEFIIFLPSRA